MYRFKVGEIRKVGIEVTSADDQNFTIDAADYRIILQESETDHGIPTIDGHKIMVLFSASTAGKYQIELTYVIGPEKFKAQLFAEVF